MIAKLRAMLRFHLKAFSLHSLTGVLAVLAHYSVMYFVMRFDGSAVLGTVIGFVFGAATKFYFSHTTVFPNNREHRDAIVRFLCALLLQAGLNLGFFELFRLLPYPEFLTTKISTTWLAQILTTGCLTVINYIVYRYWVFSDKVDNEV